MRVFLQIEVHKVDGLVELDRNILAIAESRLFLILQQDISRYFDTNCTDIGLDWKLNYLLRIGVPFLELKFIESLDVERVDSHHLDADVRK